MKKLLALAFILFSTQVWAQNITCPDRPLGDSTNACANTRFVARSPVSASGNCNVYVPVGGDNTSAFNTAATTAVSNGRALCIPGGSPASPLVISISGSLQLPSGLRLHCAGQDLTIFRKAVDSGATTFVAFSGTSNILVTDCTFDMNGQNNITAGQYFGFGAQVISNFTMERVTIKNPRNGALIEIIGDGTPPTAPNTNQQNSNITIRDSRFEAANTGVNPANGDLFDLLQIDGLLFENNAIVGGASNGSCAANGASFGYNRNFVIQNNRISNCYRGLYMETSQDGSILNNDIYNTANIAPAFANLQMIGMWLPDANQSFPAGGYGGSQRVLIQGNRTYGLSRATGTTGVVGYLLSAPAGVLAAQDIIFQSNSCFNNGVSDNTGTSTCIRLEGASDSIIVRNNTARSLVAPSIGVTTTASYTSSGMPAAQSTLDMLVSDNLCTSVTVCQTAPTATTCTLGTGASCAVTTGSSDSRGAITVTAGSSPGTTFALTITFSAALGVNRSECSFTPVNGSGSFTAPITFISTGESTTVFSVLATNGAAFTAASTYTFSYTCYGS